ncbi:glyoxylate/hydroxypyruvate reductase A [Pigmentiphaga aceris]|uniref:Glyoxylate/hydroxypyruvate reductase A n=2 Tax=Pigmentiphaga aceris TaxID=1940612 RepID=A0A5C0B3C9_9BURK|nr:glyoxylate/hydroxypyruvate reductase A [Pigmentiphaga aceris]
MNTTDATDTLDSSATKDTSVSPRKPCVAFLSAVLDMHYLVPAFKAACPGIDLRLGSDLGKLDEIDAALCWYPPAGVMSQMPNLRLVQSVGAGVDHILAVPDLPASASLCRIVDPDMARGMVAYVTWAVIHRHRHMDDYIESARSHSWVEQPVVAPRKHRVGIAGLGTLGMACARTLLGIGYSVCGWSRSAKSDLPEGLAAYAGNDTLGEFLGQCDTLICLLPLTDETRGFLNEKLFAQLPKGAHLINVGRGDHLVEADLLTALASGQVGAATLDALTQEPLPAEHPFWADPRILITPHIATRTSPDVIAAQMLNNLTVLDAGGRPRWQTDPATGY